MISISNSSAHALALRKLVATIYHGLPKDLFRFHPEPGNYLAFLGRVSPEKRVDRAIEIASERNAAQDRGRKSIPLTDAISSARSTSPLNDPHKNGSENQR
jgi:hypothetical protein